MAQHAHSHDHPTLCGSGAAEYWEGDKYIGDVRAGGAVVLVGLVQGGTQALSRSLFASMVPKHKSGEFFGFYSVFEKFGGILGPLVFAIAIGQTGSSRGAILWVIAFFVIGGAILAMVDVKEGERAARAADVNLRAV
jgi:UMF1 family MFS transporter